MVKARGGWLDLALVLAVVGATWVRTPVGNVASRGVHYVFGWSHHEPALTSYFRIDDSWERIAAHVHDPLPALPVPEGGLPEPYRTAARLVLTDGPSLDDLDAAYDGDPEAALEIAAIGAELRARAIARAQAAGVPDPQHYRAHRAYLPATEQLRADEAVDGVLAVSTLLDLAWPVPETTPVSSGWGNRVHPIDGTHRFHNGLDLAVPIGTPVHAAQAGEVVVASEDGRNGRYLVLDHGNGVRTAYCHLDRIDVAVGQRFERGQAVALSGNTGRSTGPHLHFVVRVNGKTVDPLPLRPKRPAEPT